LTLVITHSPGCRSTNSKLTFAPGLSPCSRRSLADLELHRHRRPFEAVDRRVAELIVPALASMLSTLPSA
jgi:hypothetical protein